MHKKQLLLCNWWSAGGSGAHGHGLAVRQACRLQNHLPWGDIPSGGHGGGLGSTGIMSNYLHKDPLPIHYNLPLGGLFVRPRKSFRDHTL